MDIKLTFLTFLILNSHRIRQFNDSTGDSFDIAKNIVHQVTEEFDTKVSQQTVPCSLYEARIQAYSPAIKPFISKKQKLKSA